MADNTTLNSGTGGDVIATDDISGVKYPRGKVGYGADGAYNEVQMSDPLPTAAAQRTGTVHDGTSTLLTVKRAVIDSASAASHTLVAAVASRKIRIIYMWLQVGTASTLTFRNTVTTATKLSGEAALTTSLPSQWGPSQHGVLNDTISGEGAEVAVSPNTALDGFVEYVEVP